MSRCFRTKLYGGSSLLCLVALAVPGVAVAQASAASQPPLAQSASSSNDNKIEEITVTANKRSESINKVGMTIQAINARALQQQNLTTLQDLAKAAPGLTFTESENSTPVYTLRGVGFYETSVAAYPDVSVYLDQAPLPFPVETSLTLFDLERLEVLKGPQGTLFGNNATGGAINYIAAKPTTKFEAGASVTYGRFNTVEGDGFVSGPITDKLLGRIAVSATKGDGWQYSVSRSATNGAPDKFAARMILDYNPTDDLKFELDLNGWHDGSQPQQPQFLKYAPSFPAFSPASTVPTPPPGNDRAADWPAVYPPAQDTGLFQATLRTDYNITDRITLTAITDFVHYVGYSVPDTGGTQYDNEAIAYLRSQVQDFSQEVRLSNGNTDRFRWVGGLNFASDEVYEMNTDMYAQGTAFSFFPGSRGSSFDSKQNMENYAVFGNLERDIGKFTLRGGVRVTEADRSVNACGAYYTGNPAYEGPVDPIFGVISGVSSLLSGTPTAEAAPNQCSTLNPATFKLSRFYDKLNENNVSYRGGIDWKPFSNVLGYVNIARGYKAGGFPTITGSTFLAEQPVKQESVVDYEGGVKTQLFNHHLSVNGAVFYYDYKNKQLKSRLIDPVFGVLDALVNIPKSSVTGTELEIQARPIAGLSIGAAATYLEARIDKFEGVSEAGIPQNYGGSAVPYTPKFQINGNIGYTRPLTDRFNGFVGAQVTYRSGTNASIGSPHDYTLPCYTILDLQAGVETQDGKWRAFVWGKNVTNTFYLDNVIQIEDGIVRYTGLPATYGLTVAYRF